jgi:LacI family transcriptional regulator
VLEAARAMSYRPNLSAKALVTGRSNTIGLWAETLKDIKALAVNRLLDQAKPGGYHIAIADITKDRDFETHLRAVPMLAVDGVLALECSAFTQAFLDAYPNSGVPIVSFGIYHVESTDFVAMDMQEGVVAAVRHLVEAGCRRIAYQTCAWGARPGEVRLEAYLAAVREAGIEPELIVSEHDSSYDAREALARHIASGRSLPDGIYCFHDVIAMGAHKALCDAGIRMPDDVALVGCDGLAEAEFMSPALSTVVQPVEEMGALAWGFLMRRLAEPDTPLQQTRLRPRLVIRASSDRRSAPEGR